GWRTIKDSTGTYYWHVPTGATQWQHPRLTGTAQLLDTQVTTSVLTWLTELSTFSCYSQIQHYIETTSGIQLSIYINDHKSLFICFAVRSLGWLEVEEEDLSPGRSSLAVSNVIQQLSHCSSPEQRDRQGAWGEGREMMLVLKKDTLTLLDPLDHTPLHCQPITNIRVWGVGCNNGRDFAFVAGDKDSCVLKCHVFRCDTPAKAVATALNEMCFKKTSMRPSRSLTMESISPEDLPRQVDFLEAVRQQVQKFEVQYIGNLPVSRAMGMEVLNRAIESIMNSTDRDEWEPAVIHVTDHILSLWRGEVRYSVSPPRGRAELTLFPLSHWILTGRGGASLGVSGAFPHFSGRRPRQPHLRCDLRRRHAEVRVSRVQYQKCLVAQTPPPRTKSWHAASSKVKRANSLDAFPPLASRHHGSSGGNMKKGMLAFFETFRKQLPPDWLKQP
uniref:Amyloid beta protein binding family B member 3 n=1 Tax=Cyclopterus lumpus TaxID=8103 RepID=A0A8C2Z130_CYCLU